MSEIVQTLVFCDDDRIELAPVAIGYEKDVYSIKSQSATIDGFKFGVKTKK